MQASARRLDEGHRTSGAVHRTSGACDGAGTTSGRLSPSGRSQAGETAPGAQLTNVSWSAPLSMTFEQWVHQGRQLGTIGRGVGWWLGDWLRFGNAAYGEKYVRASKVTGYDAQTLMNMAYVASRIEVSRRREKLSWSHHAEVAALPPDEQEKWMQLAERSRLSVHDLRLLLREARARERAELPEVTERESPETTCPECGHTFPAIKRRRRGGGGALSAA